MKTLVVPAVLALSGGLLVPAPATADTVNGSTLTWKVSECAFGTSPSCTSLTEVQAVAGGTTKEADGWRFMGGIGSYDPATGATTVEFPGSLTVGNTTRGGYAITLANPQVTVQGGTGALLADVSVRPSAAAPTTTVQDVRIVDLPQVPNQSMWTVTPLWDAATGKFAQPFLDVLGPALEPWFKTGGSPTASALKPAAPVSLNLGTVTPPMTPRITIEGAVNLPVSKATTITIKGSGFDPAKRTPAVQGLYVVFGPDPAKTGYALDRAGVYNAAAFLPAAPDASGNFTATLTIQGLYTDSDGKIWDGTKETLGVATWAAHSRATTAWDTFTPITFSPATKTTVRLSLKKQTVKVGQRAVARVTADGSGKVQIVKGKKTLASKRVARGKAVVRLPKLKAGKHTLRAVQGDVRSNKVVLRVKRR